MGAGWTAGVGGRGGGEKVGMGGGGGDDPAGRWEWRVNHFAFSPGSSAGPCQSTVETVTFFWVVGALSVSLGICLKWNCLSELGPGPRPARGG